MEIYTGEFIQGILNEIPNQNNHEKYITIYPFTKYHNILLNFEIIQFDESCCCCCTLYLIQELHPAYIVHEWRARYTSFRIPTFPNRKSENEN